MLYNSVCLLSPELFELRAEDETKIEAHYSGSALIIFVGGSCFTYGTGDLKTNGSSQLSFPLLKNHSSYLYSRCSISF
jgi:hypothetical protein